MIHNIRLVKHCIRVAALSFIIAKKLNLPPKKQYQVVIAGLFHDIGKFMLKSKILYKRDRLSSEEYEYVKSHVFLGANMLERLHFSKDIRTMLLQHHENFDGSGYPYRTMDLDIGSRIIKVADVYDALISNRVYRKKFTKEVAIKIMLEEVINFDFNVLRCLMSIVKSTNHMSKAFYNIKTDKI